MSAAHFTEALGTEESGSRLLVADSFRVHGTPGNAQVRGFGFHTDRFKHSVWIALGGRPQFDRALKRVPLTQDELTEFLHESVRRINDYGAGNPRLELWGAESTSELGPDSSLDSSPELRLSLRPLPELRYTIALRTARGVHVTHADRKGPNIETFTRLNQTLGAEALLIDEAEHVVEGATTAIVWWEGSRGYFSARANRVSSVTETLVKHLALGMGIAFELAKVTPFELTTREVWAVNALHGIRPVTSIDDIQLPPTDVGRLAAFREALDATWESVTRSLS